VTAALRSLLNVVREYLDPRVSCIQRTIRVVPVYSEETYFVVLHEMAYVVAFRS
jgi:hypothetical protein